MTLTQKDFDQIEKLLDEKLDEELKNLPTKEDLLKSLEKIHPEVVAS